MTLDLTSLIILALATWRLSFMLVSETGMFGVFTFIRKHANVSGVLNCIFCTSVWVAILIMVVWYSDLYPSVYVLAISGGAMVMRSWSGVGIND